MFHALVAKVGGGTLAESLGEGAAEVRRALGGGGGELSETDGVGEMGLHVNERGTDGGGQDGADVSVEGELAGDKSGGRQQMGEQFDQFGCGPKRAEGGGNRTGAQNEDEVGFGGVERAGAGKGGWDGRERKQELGEFGRQGGGGKAPGEQMPGARATTAQMNGGEMAQPKELAGRQRPGAIQTPAVQRRSIEAEKQEEVFASGLGGEWWQGVIDLPERVLAKVKGGAGSSGQKLRACG